MVFNASIGKFHTACTSAYQRGRGGRRGGMGGGVGWEEGRGWEEGWGGWLTAGVEGHLVGRVGVGGGVGWEYGVGVGVGREEGRGWEEGWGVGGKGGGLPLGSKATLLAGWGPQLRLVMGETVLISHNFTSPYESQVTTVSHCKRVERGRKE